MAGVCISPARKIAVAVPKPGMCQYHKPGKEWVLLYSTKPPNTDQWSKQVIQINGACHWSWMVLGLINSRKWLQGSARPRNSPNFDYLSIESVGFLALNGGDLGPLLIWGSSSAIILRLEKQGRCQCHFCQLKMDLCGTCPSMHPFQIGQFHFLNWHIVKLIWIDLNIPHTSCIDETRGTTQQRHLWRHHTVPSSTINTLYHLMIGAPFLPSHPLCRPQWTHGLGTRGDLGSGLGGEVMAFCILVYY